MEYKNQVLVFLDILGFRDRLKDEAGLANLHRMVVTLKKSFEEHQGDYKYNGAIIQFSDSIIITSDVATTEGLERFLRKVAVEIGNLVMADIFVRGAVCFGKHYFENDILISPLFAEAYDLETKFAVYPRVVISPDFEDRYLAHYNANLLCEPVRQSAFRPLFAYTKIDRDGFKYLDYLGAYFADRKGTDDDIDEVDENEEYLCSVHRDLIGEKLADFKDIGVLSKMIWLANYHNAYIEKRSGLSEQKRIELMVQSNKVHFGF